MWTEIELQKMREENKKWLRDYHRELYYHYNNKDYIEKRKEILNKCKARYKNLTAEQKHIINIRQKKWQSKNRQRVKMYNQKNRAIRKVAGDIPISRIQMIYEDNIKKYGTLTCIYCLRSIEFGKDTLEHKQPLSRKGTNEYENLAIACKSCNSRKGKKTEAEYREYLKS